MGRIGTAASHRAKALGMDVLFYDPYVADGWERAHGVRRTESLKELLAQAHVLSLHCPATPETMGMIGAEQIAATHRGSFLINTARGAVLDTSAIPPAIRAKDAWGKESLASCAIFSAFRASERSIRAARFRSALEKNMASNDHNRSEYPETGTD